MTPKQIELVQLFYKRLFELDPSLLTLFKSDLKEQGRRLMQMIGVAVSSLSRLDSIVPAVEALSRRHAGYGVEDEHYITVADALTWTLEQSLGKAFTPEVRAAWTSAYLMLAQTMKAGGRGSTQPTEQAA